MSPGPWTPPLKVTRYGRFGAKRRAVVKPTASSLRMSLMARVLRSEEGMGGEVGGIKTVDCGGGPPSTASAPA